MSTQTATDASRTFDGEMSSEFELWLGDAFNSWLPSKRMVEVLTPAGLYVVAAGDTITLTDGVARIEPRATRAEDLIIHRFSSLSSTAIRRILDAGAEIIEQRFEDGVFE